MALKEKSGDQAKNSSFIVKIYHLGNKNVKISYTQWAAEPVTAVSDFISTSISVKPLNIFNRDHGISTERYMGQFCVFMATKTSISSQKHDVFQTLTK